jgi:hypothetical protein
MAKILLADSSACRFTWEPPRNSVSVEPKGHTRSQQHEVRQRRCIAFRDFNRQTSEESRSDTDQTPKESLKEAPTASSTRTSNETLDNDLQ